MAGTSSSGGRNRKSAAQHRLEGTFQASRASGASSDAPDPPKGRPSSPKPLKGESLAEWTRMTDRLELAGTLSVVDDAVLYRYCRLHARAERLERYVGRLRSVFYVDHLGNPKVHPGVAQLRAYDQALRVYLVEFGMTPAARSRVRVPQATAETDPFAEFDDTTKAH